VAASVSLRLHEHKEDVSGLCIVDRVVLRTRSWVRTESPRRAAARARCSWPAAASRVGPVRAVSSGLDATGLPIQACPLPLARPAPEPPPTRAGRRRGAPGPAPPAPRPRASRSGRAAAPTAVRHSAPAVSDGLVRQGVRPHAGNISPSSRLSATGMSSDPDASQLERFEEQVLVHLDVLYRAAVRLTLTGGRGCRGSGPGDVPAGVSGSSTGTNTLRRPRPGSSRFSGRSSSAKQASTTSSRDLAEGALLWWDRRWGARA
jgi:hypothetical protein